MKADKVKCDGGDDQEPKAYEVMINYLVRNEDGFAVCC